MQPTSRPINTFALVSLACGLIGWSMAPVIASVVAIVAGHLARSQIRQTGEDGDGLAVAGLALGYASVIFTCVASLFVLAIWGAALGIAIGAGR